MELLTRCLPRVVAASPWLISSAHSAVPKVASSSWPDLCNVNSGRRLLHCQLSTFQSRLFATYRFAASASTSASAPASVTALSCGRPPFRASAPPPPAPISPARGHSTCALATGDERVGSSPLLSTTPSTDAKMGDRNILPDHFKASHYDLVLTDLDLKNWAYNGVVTYEDYSSILSRRLWLSCCL